MSEPFWDTNLIYKVVAGSRAYGLDIPESDLDVRGVCIPPRQQLLGLSRFEQWEHRDDGTDVVIYGLEKFMRLALACNPNIIEMLYTDPRHVLFVNDYGQRLLDHRHLFLSRQARRTFANYAISQLRRMERHRQWLSDPPNHQPTPGEYGGRSVDSRWSFPDCEAEKVYRAALKRWNQYQAWRKNRNPARAELEHRHGYDTKHAMHLVRLMAMGAEILETGRVHVYRHDREWLRAVYDGALSFEELLELVTCCEARLDRLYRLSGLPDGPDVEGAEALLVELQEQFLCEARKRW